MIEETDADVEALAGVVVDLVNALSDADARKFLAAAVDNGERATLHPMGDGYFGVQLAGVKLGVVWRESV